jgi:mannosyl-oligosaccharide alpha-1,2-mannosidase
MGFNFRLILTTALALASTLDNTVYAGSIQRGGLTLPGDAEEHKAAVRQIFKTSYDAYHQYAFGHDELAPLSKKGNDGRNGVFFF